ATLSLLFGLLPFLLDGLLGEAARAIGGLPALDMHLALWHGVNTALILSIITLLGGIGVYLIWDKFRDSAGYQGYDKVMGEAPKKGYENWLAGTLKLAAVQTRFFQSGYLRYYMLTLIGFFILLVGTTFALKVETLAVFSPGDIMFYEWVLAFIIVIAASSALVASSGLVAIASLGVVGYSISMFYVLFSAPDLAITQVLVETLTVILAALVLIHIPKFKGTAKATSKIRDGILAAGVGLIVSLLIIAMLAVDMNLFMTDYFAANSYVVAHGKNIVNVILVDFRALDTFGEITVLGVAGLGVYSLIKIGKKVLPKKKQEETA
ncbi:MAG: hydrogen gas-evolving membrane-bound hydrogenase subunit E, partial [Cyclonatronaceae bacterium]